MNRFRPEDIDHLLSQPAPPESRATADVPRDFFSTMEQRILSATVEAAPATPSAAPRRRPLWLAAAAVALVIVCGITVKFLPRTASVQNDIDNIYAASELTAPDDIDELHDIYDADIFLEEL